MATHSEHALEAHVRDLEAENQLLRKEIEEQWFYNHAEHCRDEWPHDGPCMWPLPEVLGLGGGSQ